MQTFTAFSPLHAVVVAAIAVLCAAAVVWRRRRGDTIETRRVEASVAWAYLCAWAGTFVWLNTKSDFEPATDWPLQLCHWTAVACALALATRRRGWRALAYFWGLALCTQAVATPNLTEGPALWPFWFFWTTHALCVGVPLYDVLAREFRPTWRDYALACGGAAGYVAIVLPVDLATGWNYGFVGPSRPDLPTIVDLLGPWPERLLAIAAIAAFAMALLMLPRTVRSLTRTPEPSPRSRRA